MALDLQPGGDVRVTISRRITRDTARKTLERLFMTDKAVSGPIRAREKNFIPIPGRRGGRVWTKWPNKVHPILEAGRAATVSATPEHLRNLNSVETFVDVQKA